MAFDPLETMSNIGDKVMGKNSHQVKTPKYVEQDPWKENRDQYDRSKQEKFQKVLHAQAMGEGPSVAREQMRAGNEAAQRQALSVAASARGSNVALAGRNASQAQGQLAMGANRDAAALRAQEMIAARQQLSESYSQQRMQDLMSMGMSAEQSRAQLGAEIAAMQARAGIAEGNAARGQQGIGGMMSMAAMGLAAFSGVEAKNVQGPIGAPAPAASPAVTGAMPVAGAMPAVGAQPPGTALGRAFAAESPRGPQVSPEQDAADFESSQRLHQELATYPNYTSPVDTSWEDPLTINPDHGLTRQDVSQGLDVVTNPFAKPETPYSMGESLGAASAASADANAMLNQPSTAPQAYGELAQQQRDLSGGMDSGMAGAAKKASPFAAALDKAGSILGGNPTYGYRPDYMSASDPAVKNISSDEQFPLVEEAAKIQPIQYQYKPEFVQGAQAAGRQIANPEASRPGVAANGGAGSLADNRLFSHAVTPDPQTGVASIDAGQAVATNIALSSELAKRQKAQDAKLNAIVDALGGGGGGGEVSTPKKPAGEARKIEELPAMRKLPASDRKTLESARQGMHDRAAAAFDSVQPAMLGNRDGVWMPREAFDPAVTRALRGQGPIDTVEERYGEWRMAPSGGTKLPYGSETREHPDYASLHEYRVPLRSHDPDTLIRKPLKLSDPDNTPRSEASRERSTKDSDVIDTTDDDKKPIKVKMGDVLDSSARRLADYTPGSPERMKEIKKAGKFVGGGNVRPSPKLVADRLNSRLDGMAGVTEAEIRDALYGMDL